MVCKISTKMSVGKIINSAEINCFPLFINKWMTIINDKGDDSFEIWVAWCGSWGNFRCNVNPNDNGMMTIIINDLNKLIRDIETTESPNPAKANGAINGLITISNKEAATTRAVFPPDSNV